VDAEQLWTKAKEIDAQVPVRKRAAFAELKHRFPQIKYRNFGSLAVAARQGRLDVEFASVVAQYATEFDALEGESRRCRVEKRSSCTSWKPRQTHASGSIPP